MKSYLNDNITMVDHIIHHDEDHPRVKHKKGLNSPPPPITPLPHPNSLNYTHTISEQEI